jgi:hypothetical protein
MEHPRPNRTYFDLEIAADSANTEIWLADDVGFFVQKNIGILRTGLIPGDYVVEFGLGTACYPVRLRENSRFTQRELEAGPSCDRPIPEFPPEE